MYVASISHKYLAAIENNQNILISEVEVLPDDTYQVHNEKTVSKIRCHKAIVRVGILVVAIILVLGSVLDYVAPKQNDEVSQFEEKLNTALSEKYEDATWIDHFGLRKENEYVDSLCIVKTFDGIDLVEVVSYDKEETFDVLSVVEDINFDSYYCVKGPSSNYYIGFKVSSERPSDDTLYYSLSFKFDSNTYWFYIDYIETMPKS